MIKKKSRLCIGQVALNSLIGNFIYYLCSSSRNAWNSESSDSESDNEDVKRPPPSKSINRRAAQKAQEKAKARKKRMSESSENSSYESDDKRLIICLFCWIFGQSRVY